MRLAVVLTVYNRCLQTCASLVALRRQQCLDGPIHVFLTDDASPDRTGTVVRSLFPEVTVLVGTGKLFWGGGMRLAFAEALRGDFDAYLWLNDDTVLSPDAAARLVRTLSELHRRGESKAIVVGATCDPTTEVVTYGGLDQSSRYHPVKFRCVIPGGAPKRCDTFNGNCVLIPRDVVRVVGNIASGFTQGMGDLDYGLRARRMGCSSWVAPGFIGTCARNSVQGSWEDVSLGLRKRWAIVCSPKGLPPSDYRRYTAQHAGPLWPVYWVMPYTRLILSALLAGRL